MAISTDEIVNEVKDTKAKATKAKATKAKATKAKATKAKATKAKESSNTEIVENTGTVLTLPCEILLNIFKYLNRQDVLNLRLSHSYLRDAVNIISSQLLTSPLIAAGIWTTIFFDNGSIFTCGDNSNGQLGHNDTTDRLLPTLIPSTVFQGKQVVQVVAGARHTIFVCSDGSVFTCGDNSIGQLGHNDTTDRLLPTLIPSTVFQGKQVVQVVAGARHTIFVCSDGSIFTCGNNFEGQLGHNDTTDRLLPTLIPSTVFQGKQLAHVVAGFSHTIFVCHDGSIFTCGNNFEGQLGHNDKTSRLFPTLIPSTVFQGKQVVQVVAGGGHTIFVCHDGSIFTCGNNFGGQLGHNDTTKRLVPTLIPSTVFQGKQLVQVVVGGEHTIFVCHDGSIFTCGNNCSGQLGHNDTTNRLLPTLIPNTVFQDKQLAHVVAGGRHTIFVCHDGSIFTCGDNSRGQLGHNDTTNRLVPKHVLAVHKPYREATWLKNVLRQNIVDLNEKNLVFSEKVGKKAAEILDNTSFNPAIPGALLRVRNLLNRNGCYDKDSPIEYKNQLRKDIVELTESRNAQPPFAPLFQAIVSKTKFLAQLQTQSFTNSQSP